jgi:glycosyltransferase involved in cell wall biosynthesis
MPRSLLYVAHPHLQGGGTGAHRTARFARFLTQAGWRVVVICGPAPGGVTRPESWPFEVVAVDGPLERRCVAPSSPIAAAAPSPTPGDVAPAAVPSEPPPPSLPRRILREALFVPDPQIFWVPSAFGAARRVLGGTRPDVVLCSGPPFSTFLVGRVEKMFKGTPLVLDYRDVWQDHPWWPAPAWRRGFEAWLERRLLGAADHVIANHESMRIQLVAHAPRIAERVTVIPNGFDAEELGPPVRPAWRPGARFEMLYSGTLYGPVAGKQGPGEPLTVQRPTGLFRALRGLVHAGLLSAGGVRLTFIGARPGTGEAATLLEHARACGVADIVEVRERMEKRDVVPHLRRAHLLVNFLYHTEVQVAQKVYDYLHLEIPILSLLRASEINAAIVHGARAGPVIDPEDDAAIVAAVAAIADDYSAGRPPLSSDRAFIDQFDLRNQGGRLDSILQAAIAGR